MTMLKVSKAVHTLLVSFVRFKNDLEKILVSKWDVIKGAVTIYIFDANVVFVTAVQVKNENWGTKPNFTRELIRFWVCTLYVVRQV